MKGFIPLVVLALLVGCANQPSSEQRLTQKEAARKNWNNARAAVLYKLAREQYSTGNLDDCRKSLDEALAHAADNVSVHVLSAKVWIELGKLEQAEHELQTARSLDAKLAEADYLSGIIYQRWEKPKAALDFYVSASEKSPAELAYLMARAEMLVAMDRRAEALDILKDRMTYFESSPAIRDAVGQLLVQDRKYAQAVPILRQANILAPEEAPIREHLALAMFYNKQYRDAALIIEKIVKDERFADRADLLTALGECDLQTARPREARESFETAAQLQPGSVTVWINLGKAALQLDDLKRAELSLKKAISLDPQGPEANLMLGYLRLKQDKLDEALQAFRKAGTLDANDSVAICMTGYVLEKKGKSNEAIDCYARALKLKPDDQLAATLMAQIQH
jgi:tetratricopeptide (TPR) repeat protein